ncbi:hypothetical protein GCM10008941_28960 [Rhizomicrobium palustre]
MGEVDTAKIGTAQRGAGKIGFREIAPGHHKSIQFGGRKPCAKSSAVGDVMLVIANDLMKIGLGNIGRENIFSENGSGHQELSFFLFSRLCGRGRHRQDAWRQG